MLRRKHSLFAAAALVGALGMATSVVADEFKFRIASGHSGPTPYVHLMSTFFAAQVKKRVEERTKHTVEWIEGYGGAMVKTSDTLEGVQTGIIDVGGYCFCFEPSNLPLHAFQIYVPFGTMDPVQSVKLARAVYDQTPEMEQRFEQKYNQKLLALIADNGYNLHTKFDWNNVSDLKGIKIGGAGANLKWLEFAGAVPVKVSAPEVYTGLQTGIYEGVIIFPSLSVNLKWHEVAKFYKLIGFGAITWHGLTINKNRWGRLPKEVQDIMLEVAREYEALTGTFNKETYPKQLQQLRDFGVKVDELPASVRADWAKSLSAWPAEAAKDFDKQGLPGSKVLRLAISEAEKLGYQWPVRYEIGDATAKK